MMPSASQSTASALANAISMHLTVLTFSGMHRTMTGRMDIIAYGENWK
jgi:hypothetical protein